MIRCHALHDLRRYTIPQYRNLRIYRSGPVVFSPNFRACVARGTLVGARRAEQAPMADDLLEAVRG
eukprot:scaffold21472_cov62-Phaeocystis_antarctica.AAC.2